MTLLLLFGRGTTDAVGASAGIATATAVGQAASEGIGSLSGVATVAAISAAVAASVGQSAGIATADAASVSAAITAIDDEGFYRRSFEARKKNEQLINNLALIEALRVKAMRDKFAAEEEEKEKIKRNRPQVERARINALRRMKNWQQ